MSRQATNASLSEAEVRSIRLRARTERASVRLLAQEYGVGAETIRRVLRWETWAWVSEEGPGATPQEHAAAEQAAAKASLERLHAALDAARKPDEMLERLEGGPK